MALSIHPSVGVARLGNAKENDFLLNPIKIGGLPYEADKNLKPTKTAVNFKDKAGRVRRQGQVFKVFDADGNELTLASDNVKSIEWTVHLANKKAAWYNFSELNGNLLYGEENSYENRNIGWRNPDVPDDKRQDLITDLGPRTVSGALQQAEFNIDSIPDNYYTKNAYIDRRDNIFPPKHVKQGEEFKGLGTLRTDSEGRLIVLGGYGRTGGNTDLEGYGGGNDWFDDISDGSVTCTITTTENGKETSETTTAWIVVGSPDFAPEIVNISNLNDTFFDVGVRNFGLVPAMYDDGFKSDYQANFDRDILPIIQRISQYQWVANVQSMSGFFSYHFDYRDNSDTNKANRMKYYNYFRQLDKKVIGDFDQPQQHLLSSSTEGDMLPMMPMNSGSNSVSSANSYDLTNNVVEKFLALDATQLFLLEQWAQGKFTTTTGESQVNEMDAASIGNCVGLPMCPGIEVTWSMQNPAVYENAYKIKHHENEAYYAKHGLSPSRDECEGGGCEPGDLTKRMACPWQADFFNCTVQVVNFSEPKVNKATQIETQLSLTSHSWTGLPDGVSVESQISASASKEEQPKTPLPPAYYSYWWPPQSPWDVLTGEFDAQGQLQSSMPAGQQINYARGINNYSQMVEHWSALAFIRDHNINNEGFPYFTETERNNELFEYREVGVGQISGNPEDDDTTLPVFFINTKKTSVEASKGLDKNTQYETDKGKLMTQYFEERAFKPVRASNVQNRSGTKARG